jgi:serine protease AprX
MTDGRNPSDPAGREDDDVVDVVYTARLRAGEVKRVQARALGPDAYGRERSRRKRVDEPEPEAQRDKVHPLLRRWVRERPGEEREQVLIAFVDPITIPRFPEPATDESRDSEQNQRLLARADELVRSISAERASEYERLESMLANHDAKVLEQFWIINGVVVDMPLSAVERLARREDVLSIEPRFSGEEPPQDEVDDGRARITTDPYFNLGLTGGWIGLLDTGVRFSHTLFNNPSHIDFRRDCINGGADCNTGNNLNPNDDCWNHGTSSAAIIVANANQGNDFRGVTGITLDSFKIYASASAPGGSCGGLDQAAAVRGFQVAVSVLDRVIVAEMQGAGDHLSAIAQAADAAFNAGAVIIAANGNNGPNDGTVNCPANAHRSIGVGSFDVQTLAQVMSQSRGPTGDRRFKPDIQAPTNTETASNTSDTARRNFSGTSGATPYAAGAAALLRNWLRGTSFSIDPGQVYAQMILSGQNPYPFDNIAGAGHLQLPTDGRAWWGKLRVADRATVDIQIAISGRGAHMLDAAIWWPELGIHIFGGTLDPHNDIDLSLVDPSGSVVTSSISINSVFERCRVAGAVTPGQWQVRVRGFSVPFGPQVVYWAAHVRL